MASSATNIQTDIVILGGGIAGLWLLESLKQQGYRTILLETEALGAGQTIKSQGIIHGGLKYALSGSLNSAVHALGDMPTRWKKCLDGTGEIDLTKVRILSNGQHMWSVNKFTGGITTMFAGAAMHSKVNAVKTNDIPAALKNTPIHGKLYKLEEIVLDVPSLLKSLATPNIQDCIKISSPTAYTIETNQAGNISRLIITDRPEQITITAQRYIFTAGSGNRELSSQLTAQPSMQVRPLHMVLVKSDKLLPLFGHCIDIGSTPRITVTTHISQDNRPVWYLGGKLAEEGVERTMEEQINAAKQELAKIFPSLDLQDAKWASFFVDRAEAKQADGKKPNSTSVYTQNNAIIAWPTKLALAPVLSDEVINILRAANIQPQDSTNPNAELKTFAAPSIAQPIWDQLL